jgi:ketosteroid isomerase-like protein
MDDLYAINAAKSEFRDCFNSSDTSRLLAMVDPDFVDFSDGQPSAFVGAAVEALKTRLENLFELFTAKLVSLSSRFVFREMSPTTMDGTS